MRRRSILFTLLLALAARTAWADCGSIPFKPWVSVFEPNQRAVIAWDGREEILILSTDLRASEPTKVLEVIPLPSEPKVKEGDVAVFYKGTELINRKLFPKKPRAFGGMGMGGMGGAGAEAALPPAGEVTFHDKIGAHDVSVTHVLDHRRFVDWVKEYLEKAGVDNPEIPPPLEAVVQDYLRDRFQWFVFDVVDLGDQTITKDAIQYRFKTRSLYYPLRITRSEEGDTLVKLLVLSPGLVRMPDPRRLRVRLVHRPVNVTQAELRELDQDLHDLLRHRSQLRLRIWQIEGRLSGFHHDLIASRH
jgi:hypothetical protein